jgi:hypothetical protein
MQFSVIHRGNEIVECIHARARRVRYAWRPAWPRAVARKLVPAARRSREWADPLGFNSLMRFALIPNFKKIARNN